MGKSVMYGKKVFFGRLQSVYTPGKEMLERIGPFPIAIMVFVFVVSIVQPRFATLTNFQNISRQASFLALIALGEMLPVVAQGFDLSPNGLVGLVSVVCCLTMIEYGIIAGIIAGLIIGALVGFVNGSLIGYKLKLNPFVVTLGTWYVGAGMSLYITNGAPVYGIPTEFGFIGAGSLGPFPVSILIAIFCFIVFHLLMTRTYFGRAIYAIGGNEVAAIQSGINGSLYRLLAYAGCGFMVGLGAIVLTSRVLSGEPTMGYHSALEGIAAVLVGGVPLAGGEGTVFNVAFGVILLALLSNCLNLLGVSTYIQTMIIGLVIILAILLDRYRRRL